MRVFFVLVSHASFTLIARLIFEFFIVIEFPKPGLIGLHFCNTWFVEFIRCGMSPNNYGAMHTHRQMRNAVIFKRSFFLERMSPFFILLFQIRALHPLGTRLDS